MSFTKRLKKVAKGQTNYSGGHRMLGGKMRPYVVINGKKVIISERGLV